MRAAAGLPLWVLPFEVLVTSAGTALIQLIQDSTSVHSIKARSAAAASAAAAAATASSSSAASASPRTPNRAAAAAANAAAAAAAAGSSSVSLSEHFFAKWRRGSVECLAAQRRFVESLAAYSLVTYLLQVNEATLFFLPTVAHS
jgi:phosphatidylinositol 4-kinase